MTRRRWIADRVEGDHAWLLGQNAHHLFRVLRAQAGQQFDIAVEGVLRVGTITLATSEKVEFHLGEEIKSKALPEIDVYISIFKFDRMEWALEKLTELGVAQIVPVFATRTAQHLAKAAEARVERWRKIAREASQQARRLAPPEIAAPVPISAVVEKRKTAAIILSEVEDSVSLKTAVAGCRPPLALAFGPEGGWTPEELEQFENAGWKPASLGQTILRAETAAIAAVAVVMAELDI
ncbi:MAG TPA: RsmE family RNA methyltransferase [Candidatus Angelobacter sp.]|nr:RsmE family RNA methyltransferase [Candidatus Angelobacter sp.]